VLHCGFSDGRSCAVAASQPPAPPTTMPLLEVLKAEKSAQKDKEAILRNHAHYKDSAAANAPRKEEIKKKAPPATVVPQKPEPGPAPLSRKAKKAAAAQKAGSPAQAAQATPAAKGVSIEGANLPTKPPPTCPCCSNDSSVAPHCAPASTHSSCYAKTSSRRPGAAVRSCVERRRRPRRRKETRGKPNQVLPARLCEKMSQEN
jgi:hypothetical protein